MNVEVTNFPSSGKLAEDAHQATLNISIPDALRYFGFRSSGQVRPLEGRRTQNINSSLLSFLKSFKKYIIIIDCILYLKLLQLFCFQDHGVECTFEGNVICDLGNPLKGKEKVVV